ncbi:MAG: hypothetical protein WCK15_20865 [Pirellula sp.]
MSHKKSFACHISVISLSPSFAGWRNGTNRRICFPSAIAAVSQSVNKSMALDANSVGLVVCEIASLADQRKNRPKLYGWGRFVYRNKVNGYRSAGTLTSGGA